jgi:hypothetical protein
MENSNRYWFPAKRYGWGWGPPNTWQGWIVLIFYILAVTGLSLKFLPDQHPVLFAIGILLPTAVMIFICWLKGEPPRWRWGGEDPD